MNKELINLIYDRLKEVKDIKWIDLNEGQLDKTDRPAVAFPAVLLDVTYPRCQNHNGGQQIIHCRIELKIAFNELANRTNANAPEDIRDAVFKRYDIIEDVHKVMQWWTAGGKINPLQRESCNKDRRADDIRVYTLVYNTAFID